MEAATGSRDLVIFFVQFVLGKSLHTARNYMKHGDDPSHGETSGRRRVAARPTMP